MTDIYRYSLALRQHWWIDAGLVGLYHIARKVRNDNSEFADIQCEINCRGLTFQAVSKECLQVFFESCYEELAACHWNVSNIKQIEAKDVVIYYKEVDKLDLIPRRRPTPIPALFTKGSSFRAEADPYDSLPEDLKKRVDDFLKEHRKTLWGSKALLVYKPPVCHPQLLLFPKKGKKTVCCVCGREMICEDVSQTSFLLFSSKTATLSFNSEVKRPDKICWECDFLSKFAIDSAHYKTSGDNLYILQIAASNLQKLIESHAYLGSQSTIRGLDTDYFLSNIGTRKADNKLLFYASLPYELLWAFFYDSYHLLEEEYKKQLLTEDDMILFSEFIQPVISNPVQLILLMISSKGQTFMLKEIIMYSELAYIFRLMLFFHTNFDDTRLLYKVFHDLYINGESKMFDPNNNLYRNKILRSVLQKKPVLSEIEQFAFHKSLKQPFPYLGSLLVFTQHYQAIIEEGSGMTKEQIEVAVKLGQQIVISAKEASNGNLDKVKGDLFSLRKTRTISSFLEQLNRIQFRYNITVSKQILAGILEESNVNFSDFRSYCLLAALNTYNNYKRPQNAESKLAD